MNEIVVAPELVDSYQQILQDPAAHGIPWRSLSEIFRPSETVTPLHILAEGIIGGDYSRLPKLIFYIVMEQVYGPPNGRAASGDLGYYLEYVPKPQTPVI